MIRRTTVGLGTFISVEAEMPASIDGDALLDRVCSEFERVETLMHPTRTGSDLLAIANTLPNGLVHVRATTFAILELCTQLWRDSGGLFDPCVPDRPGRLDNLVLEPPDGVRVRDRPVAIDLGGIAKGFAVDRGIEILREAGCTAGLVNAGGDARVFGPRPQHFQLNLGRVTLKDEAIAVSEPRSDRSPSEHRGFYSPHTGAPVTGRAVAVRAPTASIADALTKCAMLASPALLSQLLQKYSAHLLELLIEP